MTFELFFVTRQVTADQNFVSNSPELTVLTKSLALALPNIIVLSRDTATFKQLMNSFWAQKECEMKLNYVVQPREVQELSVVVKHKYDD